MTSLLIYALTDDNSNTNKNFSIDIQPFPFTTFFLFFLFFPPLLFCTSFLSFSFLFLSCFAYLSSSCFFIFPALPPSSRRHKTKCFFCCCHYYYLNINSSLCLCFQIWVSSPENAKSFVLFFQLNLFLWFFFLMSTFFW